MSESGATSHTGIHTPKMLVWSCQVNHDKGTLFLHVFSFVEYT